MPVDRFVGGMSVPGPGGFGRFNATAPLATLTIDEEGLELRFRLRRRSLGTDGWGGVKTNLGGVTVAYRLKGRVATPGVGIDLKDGRRLLFWTWTKQESVLTALRQRGVVIDPKPRHALAVMLGRG
ncbi:MAG: hypothetical protein ACYCO3_09380 [Mycobacteriales bacterium]